MRATEAQSVPETASTTPHASESLPAPEGSATWEWDFEQHTERYSLGAVRLVLGEGEGGELDRRLWFAHVHAEDAARVAATIERALAGDEDRWTMSYRVRCNDGHVRRIRDRGFIVRAQGGAVRALGDFSDEHGAGQEDGDPSAGAAEQGMLYKAIVDFIPQLCWAADVSGWVDHYNRGWYQYTGTTPEQMEGWGVGHGTRPVRPLAYASHLAQRPRLGATLGGRVPSQTRVGWDAPLASIPRDTSA